MDKFKAKYLGKGDIISYWELDEETQNAYAYDGAKDEQFVITDKGSGNNFSLGEFMRCDRTGPFDGFAGCTNTSAYGIKISKDGQSARIWTIY